MTVALSRVLPQAAAGAVHQTQQHSSCLWPATHTFSSSSFSASRFGPSWMPPKSSRRRTRFDHLIPEGQEHHSQQFYITPAAAHRDAPASVIPPRPSTDTLCDASISDDRRRILRTSIAIQPTGDAPLFDDILHSDLGEDLPDPATIAGNAPADYFNAPDGVYEGADAIVHVVDDATRELEFSVCALVSDVSRSTPLTSCLPKGPGHGDLARTP